MITLGKTSTADRSSSTQASPIRLQDGGGGSSRQSAGRLLGATFSMSDSLNLMRMTANLKDTGGLR